MLNVAHYTIVFFTGKALLNTNLKADAVVNGFKRDMIDLEQSLKKGIEAP